MKYLSIAIAACAIGVAVLAIPPNQNGYSTLYDNFNVDEILLNERLFNSYFNCLTKKQGCTPDGKFLTETIPDALATGCANCSAKQKEVAFKVIEYLFINKPDKLEELATIYDPENVYLNKYLNAAFNV